MNLEIVGVSGTVQFIAFLYILLVIVGGGGKKHVSNGSRCMGRYNERPDIYRGRE